MAKKRSSKKTPRKRKPGKGVPPAPKAPPEDTKVKPLDPPPPAGGGGTSTGDEYKDT
jgi:hypothetical protein